MRVRPEHQHVVASATDVGSMNTRDRFDFQRFNPNGLVARAKKAESHIKRLVSDGTVTSDALVMYDGLGEVEVEPETMRLDGKQRIRVAELEAWEKDVEENVLNAENFLAMTLDP